MRKLNLMILLCIAIFFSSCSKFDNPLSDEKLESSELNLPKESEVFGKAVAKEIRTIVNKLNEKNYDFTALKGRKNARNQFFKDIYAVSPSAIRTKSLPATYSDISPTELDRIRSEFSDIQIEFVERIINEYKQSKSYEDYVQRLSSINKDIETKVPKIEQERLYKIISVLYYGLGEFDSLYKNGLFVTESSNLTSPRLKSFSEDGDGGGSNDGGIWASCKEAFSTTTAFIIGAATTAGEVVTAAGTKVVQAGTVVGGTTLAAAATVFFGVLCLKGDTPDYTQRCNSGRDACVANPWKNGVRLDCQSCYQQCLHNRVWKCPVY